MSHWLVHLEASLPSDLEGAALDNLMGRERDASHSLQRAGSLVAIWRVPGRLASWSIWQSDDATQLHEVLSSLPAWPYCAVTVHPLAEHPNSLQALRR